MRSAWLAIYLGVCLPLSCLMAGEPSPSGGGCILYGSDWATAFKAPDGWQIECRGPGNDVEVAAFPKGSSWNDAKVVMYVNSTAPEGGESLAQFAENELERFKKDSPNLHVTERPGLATMDKKPAIVRHLTGDKWGNHEAVAYIDGGAIRLIVVMSSRSEKAFKKSLGAFDEFITQAFFTNVVQK